MSAFSRYAAACEHTAMMLPRERAADLTAYVKFAQGDADGLPVSGDALAVMRRGTRIQQYRRRARARLQEQEY